VRSLYFICGFVPRTAKQLSFANVSLPVHIVELRRNPDSDNPVVFNELKSLYAYNQNQDIILFNNKELLADGKPIFLREWFNKGIISILDLLDESGNLLPFQEFSRLYPFQTNFLQYYQVISAIPKHLLSKANRIIIISNDSTFYLNDSVQINFEKVKGFLQTVYRQNSYPRSNRSQAQEWKLIAN